MKLVVRKASIEADINDAGDECSITIADLDQGAGMTIGLERIELRALATGLNELARVLRSNETKESRDVVSPKPFME